MSQKVRILLGFRYLKLFSYFLWYNYAVLEVYERGLLAMCEIHNVTLKRRMSAAFSPLIVNSLVCLYEKIGVFSYALI